MPGEARARTLTKVPRLWRTRDPRELVSMGQLELPGLGIEHSKTSEQAWAELESASEGEVTHASRS
ncbi:hypothetical protein ES703_110352 [subsurface metagenome]